MSRRALCVLAVCLVLCFAACALAQPAKGATGAKGGEKQKKWTEEDLRYARAYYRELIMIELIQALHLSVDQAKALIGAMETIQQARREIAKIDDSFYKGRRNALENFIKTWAQYGFVPPYIEAPVTAHMEQYQAQAGRHLQKIREAIAFVYQEVLTADQRSALETPAERLAKQALARGRRRRAGGASFEEVMNRLLDVRRIPQPVYEQRKQDIARQIAVSIVGERSEGLAAMTARVLLLLDEVRSMDAATLAQQRAELEKKVRTRLGFEQAESKPGEGEKGQIKPDVVAQEAFETFLRDPRALDLLRRVVAAYEEGQ